MSESRQGRAAPDIRSDRVIDATLLGHSLRLNTTWGLFSPRAIDDGTALLLDYLVFPETVRALDVGCGYGPLGLAIAAAAPLGEVHLVDKDFVAIDYARRNATQNQLEARTEIYLSNMLADVPASPAFDLIVSNLPAKSGNELYTILFEDAHARLAPGGQLVIVTINGLRQFIKRSFKDIFGNYDKLKQGAAYTVSMATRER